MHTQFRHRLCETDRLLWQIEQAHISDLCDQQRVHAASRWVFITFWVLGYSLFMFLFTLVTFSIRNAFISPHSQLCCLLCQKCLLIYLPENSVRYIVFSAPIFAALSDIWSCRAMVVAGGIIAALGLFIASFSRSLQMIIFAYGVLFGMLCLFVCFLKLRLSFVPFWAKMTNYRQL